MLHSREVRSCKDGTVILDEVDPGTGETRLQTRTFIEIRTPGKPQMLAVRTWEGPGE